MGVWTKAKLVEASDLGSDVLESPNLSAPTILACVELEDRASLNLAARKCVRVQVPSPEPSACDVTGKHLPLKTGVLRARIPLRRPIYGPLD